MKSTYKLIGQFWDGKPIPKEIPHIHISEEQLEDSVRLSYILKLKDEEIENNIPLGGYKYLYIDYIPSLHYSVFLKFYSKRLLQIAYFYNLEIVCNSDISKYIIENMMAMHIKSKIV